MSTDVRRQTDELWLVQAAVYMVQGQRKPGQEQDDLASVLRADWQQRYPGFYYEVFRAEGGCCLLAVSLAPLAHLSGPELSGAVKQYGLGVVTFNPPYLFTTWLGQLDLADPDSLQRLDQVVDRLHHDYIRTGGSGTLPAAAIKAQAAPLPPAV